MNLLYCVNCGVELADSEQKCPLCFTRVYHPDIQRESGEPLYPDNPPLQHKTVTRSGILFIVTSLFLLGMLLPLICNLNLNGKATWSGVVIGAVLLAYIIIVLPIWFSSPNPVVFVPVDYAACGLYLLYLNIHFQGGWFLTFAFPVVGIVCVITTAAVALCRYLRRGYLYIFGGTTILTGGAMLLIEFLLNLTFDFHTRLVWSVYPFTACFLIGLLLIIIAINPRLRQTLQKKFFV